MKKRITIDLPEGVLSAVDDGAALVRESRNRFIVAAVEERLRTLERSRVDEAFAAIADDPDYRKEQARIEKEMSRAADAAWGNAGPPAGARGTGARKPRLGSG